MPRGGSLRLAEHSCLSGLCLQEGSRLPTRPSYTHGRHASLFSLSGSHLPHGSEGCGGRSSGSVVTEVEGTDECNDMGSGGNIQGGIPPAACRGGLTSPGSVSPEQLAYWPQRGVAGDSSGQTLVSIGLWRGVCRGAFKAKAFVPQLKI